MINNDNKEFTAPERLLFLGHLFFSIGTLCISISGLLKLAQDGSLPETPVVSRTASVVPNARDQAVDFFRRS